MQTTLPLPPATLDRISARAVDRRWVHRSAISEVFLTDIARTGPGTFVACCQLPRRHFYFTDHAGSGPDPMLLLECARQAETCCAHIGLGLPLDTRFVLDRWHLRLIPLPDHSDRAPTELRVEIESALVRTRGTAHTHTYTMTLRTPAGPVGVVTMTVTYLSSASYEAIRRFSRSSPPPSSADVPLPARSTVPAERTGRSDPRNVLLENMFPGQDGSMCATVVVPVDHPVIFDHPLDHLPGFGVTEAAGQLAVAVTGAPEVQAFDGVFRRFVELDEPFLLTTTEAPDSHEKLREAREIGIRCVQSGRTAAEFRFVLADGVAAAARQDQRR
ncbi:AfsA-related hotdog domain-containing protein [Nocardia sp. alder85J]|uniref:AfsA-related hotdog domain-containing protein n=1 Tax=Nocardia sp. alder85J TaxID=2862949 RepID=UPI001CD41B01|nr:AfsA-related hotdog domain-containing protein [Nocardia sp. alder85J]MCX4097505.1 AfsA-related hotdog domain-containing protein [Nocardia sp. alder85J]